VDHRCTEHPAAIFKQSRSQRSHHFSLRMPRTNPFGKDRITVMKCTAFADWLPLPIAIVRANKVFCVDINPSTVIMLSDCGSLQSARLVTDVAPFLRVLVDELNVMETASRLWEPTRCRSVRQLVRLSGLLENTFKDDRETSNRRQAGSGLQMLLQLLRLRRWSVFSRADVPMRVVKAGSPG
jgi:hypothetical protein